MSSFIDAGYVVPASAGSGGGRYINPSKIPADVPFRFRILSDQPLMGWEYWTIDNRPVRLPYDQSSPTLGKPTKAPQDIRLLEDGKADKIKHFWAFIVWDYGAQSVKLFQATQQSIQTAIRELAQDGDWGHPRGYDLKLVRTGKGLQTEYSLLPGRQGEIPPEALAALDANPINLAALLAGEDPFDGGGESATVAVPSATDLDALKAAARAAGYPTATKVRAYIVAQGGTFTTFEALSPVEVEDYTAIFQAQTPETVVDYEVIPF